MYEGDSFFTLTPCAKVGLVIVSLCLAAVAIGAVSRLAKGRVVAKRLAIAIGVFWVFLWVAPQVHYLYYMTIFDGLPWQTVVKMPPLPIKVFQVMFLSDRNTLSAHASGILGWVLIGTAFRRLGE